MNLARSLLAGLAALAFAGAVQAASLPLVSGPQDPSQINATLNQVIGTVNAAVPGFASLYAGKNFLDNGSMAVIQRGSADTTGAATAGCVETSYPVDRWCVDTNVTSGVGHGQSITATPSPPPGFQRSVKIWRNSGALLQKIMLMQEIETARAIALQGQMVIASCSVQPLAGYTGTAALSMNLFTGTGSDEGLGGLRGAVGMTASPALTPAWTGIAANPLSAGAASPSWVIGTTAAWSRIYSAPFAVPVGTTEAAFAIGFTPVGSSSGATDGIATTGCMLEISDPNQTAPSAYEHIPTADAVLRAQRFYYQMVETTGGYFCPGIASATNVQTLTCDMPVPMQNLPILAVTAGGFSYRDNGNALAVTTPVISSATGANNKTITITDGSTQTVAHTAPLYGTNTTGKLTFGADF